MTAVVLHHVEDGPADGPVVLLLGSLGSTTSMWDAQVPALAEHLRVVRADLRGHGASPAPPGPYTIDDLVDDVVALLDRLGVQRAHVVGLSLGGMVAVRLAARHPERVRRLALLCTSAHLPPADAWRERAATVRARGTSAVAEAVVARWLTPAGAAAEPDRVRDLRSMVEATPDEGYAACCEAIADMDLREDLERVLAPTLAIAGADDPATPPAHLAVVSAAVPGAGLLVLPGAAHLANVEQAAAVTAALIVHLSGQQDAERHQRGMVVRRQVLGDQHVDQAVAATTPFTAAFQDFITRTAWGDVWSRDDLTRRDRSLVTLAALTSLGHTSELALHVRAARRNGLSDREIAGVLLHTAVYAGVPAANSAFAVAARVLAAEPADDPATEDGRSSWTS